MIRPTLGALALAVLLTFLYAPGTVNAEQATRTTQSTCTVLDGDGGFMAGPGLAMVSNGGGVTVMRCSLDDVPNSTGRAVHYDYESTGMMCYLLEGPTADWHETVSADGQATLTCKYDKKKGNGQ